jgi:PAS domain S-box-containing protein
MNDENIRDNKRTARQLQEALDYAENIVSTIREPLLVLDGGLRIISASPSFYRVFSVMPEETVGKLIYEIANGQWNIPKLRELLENILPKNTSFENYEIDHEFPNFGRRIMLLNARRIHDGGVKTQKILLAIEDITERKIMEKERNSSELRYRRLFEAAQDGILILDAQTGEITDVNPFLLKMLGYSSQELKGKRLWEIGFFKDTEASHQAFRVLQEMGYVRYEDLPLETKEGRPMEVEFVSNVYSIDSQKVIQCNVRDITARKLAEEELKLDEARLESLLRISQYKAESTREFLDYSLQEAIKLTGSKIGYIYLYNEEKKEFTLNSWSKEVMKECTVISPQTVYQLDKTGIWGEVVRQRKPIIVNDYQAPHPLKKGYPDGHANLYRWMSVPVFSEDRIVAVVGIANKDVDYSRADVRQLTLLLESVWKYAERERAEEVLKQRTAQLEAANRELESFSYSVSHDLRAPLRALDGFSEMVLEDYKDKLDETGKDHLNRIRKASHTMSQLIDDMLKLSRITRAEMLKDEVNLSELAQSIYDELKVTQPERQAEFNIAPLILVDGDKQLLQILMRNLLENSWKFTSKCSQTRLKFEVNQQDGKKIYFITDNGAGFDMQYADKLFQPFQRLHTNKEYTGTGIGLAIVQRVIQRHGGRIWAESEIGKGTTFYFTLN